MFFPRVSLPPTVEAPSASDMYNKILIFAYYDGGKITFQFSICLNEQTICSSKMKILVVFILLISSGI